MQKNPSKEREKTVQDERTTEVDCQRGSNNLPGADVMNFLSIITKHRKFISRFVVGATVPTVCYRRRSRCDNRGCDHGLDRFGYLD